MLAFNGTRLKSHESQWTTVLRARHADHECDPRPAEIQITPPDRAGRGRGLSSPVCTRIECSTWDEGGCGSGPSGGVFVIPCPSQHWPTLGPWSLHGIIFGPCRRRTAARSFSPLLLSPRFPGTTFLTFPLKSRHPPKCGWNDVFLPSVWRVTWRK